MSARRHRLAASRNPAWARKEAGRASKTTSRPNTPALVGFRLSSRKFEANDDRQGGDGRLAGSCREPEPDEQDHEQVFPRTRHSLYEKKRCCAADPDKTSSARMAAGLRAKAHGEPVSQLREWSSPAARDPFPRPPVAISRLSSAPSAGSLPSGH